MKKYISYGDDNIIRVISSSNFTPLYRESGDHVSKTSKPVELYQKFRQNNKKKLKIALICNWNQQCGISTYSKFIFDELKSYADDYKIFSEYQINGDSIDNDHLIHCWKRGENLKNLTKKIKEYKPNFILIQHEWGIFPKAGHFMSFIQEIKRLNIPILVALHSVYNHLDKLIPLSVLDNVIVHSEGAKNLLKSLNFKGNIFVVPHGCPLPKKYEEVWNTFQTPYLIFGYGFGFKYKGVEVAIEAIKHLKNTDPKFKNILYIYVCSESDTNKGIHEHYYYTLMDKVESENLQENVLLIKGFLDETTLDIYLKTVKMVIFPYVSDPNNNVFGSSGAIKIAMSYGSPVIGSSSHLFDDIDGYVIRISNHLELANEIDKLFSSSDYRKQMVELAHKYISENTWSITAERYFNVIKQMS